MKALRNNYATISKCLVFIGVPSTPHQGHAPPSPADGPGPHGGGGPLGAGALHPGPPAGGPGPHGSGGGPILDKALNIRQRPKILDKTLQY